MPGTLLALQVFLILLPGFSAAYIVQALSTRRAQSDLERIIEAIVFSFVIYVVYMVFNAGKLPFQVVHDPLGKTEDTILWNSTRLVYLSLVSLLFSFASVAYVRFDGNRLFQRVGLTERTTKNSIWNDVFETEAIKGQPLQVELADGRSVLGCLHYYSDAAEDASIYLTDASWVDANANTVSIPGAGILLTKNCGIRSISLLNPVEQEPNKDEPSA